MTKVLAIECPVCKGESAVLHVTELQELVGCKLGCSTCGNRLVVEPFSVAGRQTGKLVVENDVVHKDYNKPLPKA